MSRYFNAGAVLVLTTVACDREEPESVLSAPIEDGAQIESASGRGLPSAALEAIVEARCAREQRCGGLGPGREYVSRDECRRTIRAEWVDELNALVCSRGVEEEGLASCLRAMNQSNCNDILDALERWTACRASDICDVPPEPPPIPLAHDPAVPG